MEMATNFTTTTLAPFAAQAGRGLASIAMEYPGAAIATAGALVLGLYLTRGSSSNLADKKIVQETANEIKNLNVAIGDADSYKFSAQHGKPVAAAKTKAGALSMMAAFLNAVSSGNVYGEGLDGVLELGNNLLTTKSGVCDHMAAAVIAGITNKVRKTGAKWDSHVELVGNGGHAFVIIGRDQNGDINKPDSWGSKAMLVDTWLSSVGINDSYKHELAEGSNGVVTRRSDIKKNMTFFGTVSVNGSFSPEEIRGLSTVE